MKESTDLGKISLWLDERPETKTLATGKILLFLEGEQREVDVYIYPNEKKVSPKSPDYYGFIKEAPAKKAVFAPKPIIKPVVVVEEDTTDDEDLAF